MPFTPFRSKSRSETRVRVVEGLLEEHEGALIRYATRLLGFDAERARDVVQEAFLRLCKQDDVEGLGREWLFTVTRRLCIDVTRKESRMTTIEDEYAVGAPEPGSSRAMDADSGTEAGENLSRAIHRLPERQQEALRLKFESGLSYAEIAGVMETSAGNVGWILHTAIQGLKARMTPEGGLR